MSARATPNRLRTALTGVRPARLFVLVLVSFAVALACDWLRDERVVFPAPLPKFNTVPASR